MSLLLLFRPSGSVDTTAPTLNVTVGPTATKISRVVGKDSTDVTFQTNEDFVEYQVRVVSNAGDPVTMGTLVEQATGAFTASTPYVVNITDDELVAASPADGTKILKIFAKDAAGNWST